MSSNRMLVRSLANTLPMMVPSFARMSVASSVRMAAISSLVGSLPNAPRFTSQMSRASRSTTTPRPMSDHLNTAPRRMGLLFLRLAMVPSGTRAHPACVRGYSGSSSGSAPFQSPYNRSFS